MNVKKIKSKSQNTCNGCISKNVAIKCVSLSTVGSSRHKLTVWSQSHTLYINPGELLLQLDWGKKGNLGSVTPAKQSNQIIRFLDGIQSGELMLYHLSSPKKLKTFGFCSSPPWCGQHSRWPGRGILSGWTAGPPGLRSPRQGDPGRRQVNDRLVVHQFIVVYSVDVKNIHWCSSWSRQRLLRGRCSQVERTAAGSPRLTTRWSSESTEENHTENERWHK